MTVAPSSSGRVPRSTPAGALPTGVRTAETMTASFMRLSGVRVKPDRVDSSLRRPVSEQIFDRVGDFADLAVEQMIGRVDDDELLRIRGARVELAYLLQRADLVALAVHEELRLAAPQHGGPVVMRHRHRDANERRDA